MTATAIEWTDATWNPVTGCTKVSSGCKNCYAEGVAARFWGERKFTDVQCHEDRLDQPLRWRKPRRVFVNSMSDLFHDAVPDAFIDRVFAVMALSPRHTFQVLTKRPARMLAYCRTLGRHHESDRVSLAAKALDGENGFRWVLGANGWHLPNVWLGVSVENQAAADERIPLLLQTPAAMRFLSCEPMLGPLDLSSSLPRRTRRHMRADVEGMLRNRSFSGMTDENGKALSREQVEQRLREMLTAGVCFIPVGDCDDFDPVSGCRGHALPGIDWVIAGGESGTAARPCDVEWIRSIVQQCQAAAVPCFVKQLGQEAGIRGTYHSFDDIYTRHCGFWPQDDGGNGWILRMKDRKGGDPAEWPEDLRVREFPAAKEPMR